MGTSSWPRKCSQPRGPGEPEGHLASEGPWLRGSLDVDPSLGRPWPSSGHGVYGQTLQGRLGGVSGPRGRLPLMAAGPEGLLESLEKTRAGPWPRRPPQAEGPPHVVQDAGPREHPWAGVPILEEQSRGGQWAAAREEEESRAQGLHPTSCQALCLWSAPSYAETVGCPRPLPGNLAPGLPAASSCHGEPGPGQSPWTTDAGLDKFICLRIR